MRERPVLAAHDPQHEIRSGDPRPREHVPRRVAEDDRVPRVLRDRAEQPLVVRVAAHHPVQHDDVGGLDPRRVFRDVVEPAVDARRVDPGLVRRPRASPS